MYLFFWEGSHFLYEASSSNLGFDFWNLPPIRIVSRPTLVYVIHFEFRLKYKSIVRDCPRR